ncbi:hypothetical protein M422DRAFT_157181, partial [Sphaerobolus stellatus SS14]
WKHLIWLDTTHLAHETLTSFARAFTAKGSPFPFLAGLIDGTLQKDARLVHNQHLLYNGWKHIHCLKYHAALSPDGLVIRVFGPINGRQHDKSVFKESGLADLLENHFWTPAGEPLYLYLGTTYDSAGRNTQVEAKSLQYMSLTFPHRNIDLLLHGLPEPVEWLFKEVTQQFTFIDFACSQKVLLSPCGLYYLIALLMCDAHTILHYPQIPQYFHCHPPTLQEYFRGGPVEDSELDTWCVDSVWEEIEADVEVESEEENEQ